MNPVISIIVPIYKVESYLHNCIDSILKQTFTNYELILVNDGSPDNCREICDDYALIDERIKVIHQINKGVSAARNAGIRIAKGAYIAFVDPDDVVLPQMYEILTEQASKHDADMVVCQYNEKNEVNQTEKVPQVWNRTNKAIDHETIIHEILPNVLVNNSFSLFPCYNKLYKRIIFDKKDIKFDEELTFGEDKRLNITILPQIDKLVFVEQALYMYLIRGIGSLSQVFRDDFYFYLLNDRNFSIEICAKYNKTSLIETTKEQFTTRVLLYVQEVIKNTKISTNEKRKVLKEILNDETFIDDIRRYETKSFYYKLLKYLCIRKNERYLTKVMQWKNSLKTHTAE